LLVGLLLASQTRALWQLYLSFSLLVGVGVAATYVPSVSTVQRWFVRRRGLASGLAGSGIGLGTLLGPLLARWLIGSVGWRPSYVLAGVAAAGLTWAAGWLLRGEPRDLGLFPDGVAAPRSPAAGGRGGGGLAIGEVLRSRRFLWLYVTMAGVCVPIFLATGHIVPFARDAGLAEAGAVASLGAVGVGSTLGRLVLGPLLDRLGRERAYVASVAAVAALMGAWLVLPGQLGWLLVWATAFGTAYGAFVALSPAVMADVFGARTVSGSIGVLYTGAGLGNLVGPWLGGVLFDRTGSYQLAIAAALVSALVALRAAQAALSPGRRTRPQRQDQP
jgi:MFS transporter, OFA family, oxalate/formate antiporter